MRSDLDSPDMRQALRSGDKEAFRLLARTLAEPLYRYAVGFAKKPADAEELVQQTFVRLFQSRRRIPADGAFRGYCFRVLRNLALNAIRDAGLRRTRESEAATMAKTHHDPDQQELGRQAWELTGSLDAETREVIELRYGHGLELAEVAAALDIPEGTVSTRQRNGLQELRARLERSGVVGVTGIEALDQVLIATPGPTKSLVIPKTLVLGVEAVLMASMAKKTAATVATLLLLLLCGSIIVYVIVDGTKTEYRVADDADVLGSIDESQKVRAISPNTTGSEDSGKTAQPIATPETTEVTPSTNEAVSASDKPDEQTSQLAAEEPTSETWTATLVVTVRDAGSHAPISGATVTAALRSLDGEQSESWAPGGEPGHTPFSEIVPSSQTSDGGGKAVFAIRADALLAIVTGYVSAKATGYKSNDDRFNSRFQCSKDSETRMEVTLEPGYGVIEGTLSFDPPLPEDADVESILSGTGLCAAADIGGTVALGTDIYPATIDAKSASYRINDVPAGAHFVFLLCSNEIEQLSKNESVIVRHGEVTKGPAIVLSLHAEYRGVAFDQSGHAIAKQHLSIQYNRGWTMGAAVATTNEDGAFTAKLPRKVVWIEVSVEDRIPVRFDRQQCQAIIANDLNFGDIVFSVGARIWGRVLVASTGKPTFRAKIEVDKLGAAQDWSRAFGATIYAYTIGDRAALKDSRTPWPADLVPPVNEKGGWFFLEAVPPGRIKLTAQGTEGGAELELDVLDGQTIGPLEIFLKGGQSVEGKLAWGSDGQPAVGLGVAAYKAEQLMQVRSFYRPLASGQLPFGAVRQTTCVKDGLFTLTGMPAGSFFLLAQIVKGGVAYRALSQPFEVVDGSTDVIHLDLTLERVETFTVNVYLPTGAAAKRAGIYACADMSMEHSSELRWHSIGWASGEQSPLHAELDVEKSIKEVVVYAPGCEAKRVALPDIRHGGKMDVTLASAPGATVTLVFAGSRAAAAGIHAWDRIIAINGNPVSSGKHLLDLIAQAGASSALTLSVMRDGAQLEITVKEGEGNLGFFVE